MFRITRTGALRGVGDGGGEEAGGGGGEGRGGPCRGVISLLAPPASATRWRRGRASRGLGARCGVGRTPDERLEVLRWVLFDNHKFTSYFATYRFMKAFGPSAPDPAVMNWLRGRLDAAFGIVDKHLAGRDYMVGAQPTIADISLAGYL